MLSGRVEEAQATPAPEMTRKADDLASAISVEFIFGIYINRDM